MQYMESVPFMEGFRFSHFNIKKNMFSKQKDLITQQLIFLYMCITAHMVINVYTSSIKHPSSSYLCNNHNESRHIVAIYVF